MLINYQSICANSFQPINISQQNNQGKFVSTSEKENTNGNNILKVQIDFIVKIIINHPSIYAKLYQALNNKQCKISTDKHSTNKKITHANILLNYHLLIYNKIISLYDFIY